jgi:Domain of unknown function (DUF4157)
MTESVASQRTPRNGDNVGLTPSAGLPASPPRSRSADRLLRPSQVPVTGPTAGATPSSSPAGERVRARRHLRPSGSPLGERAVPAQPSAVQGVLGSSGRPLDAAVRAEMEARFGADFSDVHVHTGRAAQRSAAELGAQAYSRSWSANSGTTRISSPLPRCDCGARIQKAWWALIFRPHQVTQEGTVWASRSGSFSARMMVRAPFATGSNSSTISRGVRVSVPLVPPPCGG